MPCRNHPLVETGLDVCRGCEGTFCPQCLADFLGHPVCAACKEAAVGRMEAGRDAFDSGESGLTPWERRHELGVLKAYYETTRQVMLQPGEFFRRIDVAYVGKDGFAFPVVTAFLALLVGWILNLVLMALIGAALGQIGDEGPAAVQMLAAQGPLGFVGVLVQTAFYGLLMPWIWGGLIHLALRMTRATSVPYGQTVRGWCYATAPYILGVIPLAGIVGFVWSLVVSAYMVKRMHRTTTGVAVFAALAPLLLLAVFGCGAILLFAGVAAALS